MCTEDSESFEAAVSRLKSLYDWVLLRRFNDFDEQKFAISFVPVVDLNGRDPVTAFINAESVFFPPIPLLMNCEPSSFQEYANRFPGGIVDGLPFSNLKLFLKFLWMSKPLFYETADMLTDFSECEVRDVVGCPFFTLDGEEFAPVEGVYLFVPFSDFVIGGREEIDPESVYGVISQGNYVRLVTVDGKKQILAPADHRFDDASLVLYDHSSDSKGSYRIVKRQWGRPEYAAVRYREARNVNFVRCFSAPHQAPVLRKALISG